MIKINSKNLIILALEHFNFFESNYADKLKFFYNGEKEQSRKEFLKYLCENKKEIIIGKPDTLEKIRRDLEVKHNLIYKQIVETTTSSLAREKVKAIIKGKKPVNRTEKKKYNSVTQEQEFKAKLESIFNYDLFPGNFTNAKGKWGAYTMAERLSVFVCPYCNRHYTSTLRAVKIGRKVEQGGTRPQFDHFLSKSKFPFFALSFYNLIPSCSICNASLKSTREFTIDEYVHPYVEGFDDNVLFTVKLKKDDNDKDYLKAWYSDNNHFDIEFNYVKTADPSLIERAKRNVKVFRLDHLYNQHKDYVMEILVKAEMYSPDAIDALVKDFPKLFPKRDYVIRLITNNYIHQEDLGKRVLAKLSRDISREYNIK
ncbi:hypothetical protein COJ01_19960 [Priestia megaterium]|uniref:hypothetical protein n=1 Tax=Priestia megaterium TaxID=1404 RepID=UPI000BF8CF2B|nr:hypothetical protein [Priestia megaterium]PFK99265.1 hypothetical protein COJ01_19960 [Priestia megaterium]